jgi:hypothetical protein
VPENRGRTNGASVALRVATSAGLMGRVDTKILPCYGLGTLRIKPPHPFSIRMSDPRYITPCFLSLNANLNVRPREFSKSYFFLEPNKQPTRPASNVRLRPASLSLHVDHGPAHSELRPLRSVCAFCSVDAADHAFADRSRGSHPPFALLGDLLSPRLWVRPRLLVASLLFRGPTTGGRRGKRSGATAVAACLRVQTTHDMVMLHLTPISRTND